MTDMTDSEKKVMQEHSVYWRTQMEKGQIVMYGPVADPRGAWGIGIVNMSTAKEVEEFGKNDPAIKSSTGFKFEFYPMPTLVQNTKE